MPDFLHADKENFSDEELMQEEQIRPQSFKKKTFSYGKSPKPLSK